MLTMMAEPLCTQASGQEFKSLRAVRQLRRLQEIGIAQSLSETQFGQHVKSNWAMLLVDERCLQPDLVDADRIVPFASVAASRDLDASSSTQRAAT